jgi:hypothetical protein
VTVTFALFVYASFLPERRLWGLNHLAFYPGHWRLVVLGLTAIVFVPPFAAIVARGGIRVARAWLRSLEDGVNTLALTGVISFIVFAAFRSATKLLGDGYFVFHNYRGTAENGFDLGRFISQVTVAEKIYPATELLNFAASWIAGWFGASPIGGVWILNCAIGALMVVTLLHVVRRLDWPDSARMTLLFLVLATGALQLFFGYVEHYTPALALGFLYILFAARVIEGSGRLVTPGLILLAGLFFHVQLVLLAPSYLWLLLWVLAAGRNPAWSLRLAIAVGLATVAGLLVAVYATPLGTFALPLSSAEYGVFTGTHLLDIVNIVLLLNPVLLLLAVISVFRLFAKKQSERRVTAFALSLGVPAWLFILFVRPELGLARDWDLYAITVLGIAAPGVFSLARTVARSKNPARYTPVLVPAIVFSVALVVSWIGLNASAGRSVARYRAILVYDTTNPGYTYENLALFYQENYQYSLQIDALEKAYELSHNPRILQKLGRVYNENNNPARAEQVIRLYLAAVPENKEARIWLVGQLAKREALDEMIEMCIEGIEYSPRTPDYHFFLGNAYLAKGNTKEGLKAFEACSRLKPPPVMVREMKRLTDQTGGAGRQAD